jgi:hypothetical protein
MTNIETAAEIEALATLLSFPNMQTDESPKFIHYAWPQTASIPNPL